MQTLPESSMGSQHVNIVLNTGEVMVNITVFNGRFAQLPRELGLDEGIVNIVMHDAKKNG